jgi:hypothetical protein
MKMASADIKETIFADSITGRIITTCNQHVLLSASNKTIL